MLRRLGGNIYKNGSLWAQTMWTLLKQEQTQKASRVAKKYMRVKDRDVSDMVPAMLAALYYNNLSLASKLLTNAEGMDPSTM